MICENCQDEHDGQYGSGRFCSKKCASIYSSNKNKEQKGKNISLAMKKRWKKNPHIDPSKFKSMAKKALKVKKEKYKILYETGDWDDLPLTLKKKRVLEEQNNKCAICGINKWQGMTLVLQFDHINGNRKNNSRKNIRFICPNCHSQTKTYCGNKQKLPQFEYLKITKEHLKRCSSTGEQATDNRSTSVQLCPVLPL